MKATYWSLLVLLTGCAAAMAATYEVTDPGDDGAGTLRWAITEANANAGSDTITFDLASPYRVQPASALPDIDAPDGLVIDGTSQPGYAGTPLVILDGSGAAGALACLSVYDSTSVVVRALTVTSWQNGLSFRRGMSNRVESCVIMSNALSGIYTEEVTDYVIGGSGAGEGNCIVDNVEVGIYLYGNGNVIQGCWIGTDGTSARPNGTGVLIWSGESNIIGGAASGEGNVISGNGNYGVQMVRWASNNTVIGNRIGTDPAGTAAVGNAVGVILGGPQNVIGGSGAGEGNLISGNTWGVRISDPEAWGNRIEGNTIGLGATGMPVPNYAGIQILAASNQVGGTAAGIGNQISGNESYGLQISGAASVSNRVQGNIIGGGVAGIQGAANGEIGISLAAPRNQIGGGGIRGGNQIVGNGYEGVALSSADSSGNRIELNVIAYNGAAGIQLFRNESASNLITANSIYLNGKLGIDLGNDGPDVNDSQDPDAGPNLRQNYPVLTLVSNAGASMTIGGTLDSTPDRVFVVEFFDSAGCDPSGHGEGQTYLGSQTVTTGVSGITGFTNSTIESPPTPPSFVTATARDLLRQETSEFSRYLMVDSDGDGMADGWEFLHFGSASGGDPAGHSDADPVDNLGEFLADTDPLDETDYLRFTDIACEPDASIRVDVASAATRMYRLEDQVAPDQDSWASRLSDRAGTGGDISWGWNYSSSTTVFRCFGYLP